MIKHRNKKLITFGAKSFDKACLHIYKKNMKYKYYFRIVFSEKFTHIDKYLLTSDIKFCN